MTLSPHIQEAAKFMGFLTVASIAYGVMHDLVTAHLAVDYFTVHHPKVIESQSPIVMALLWGFLATFWVGLLGGAWLIACNQVGVWGHLDWKLIRGKVVVTLVALWLVAMGSIVVVYAMAGLAPLDQRGPTFEHDRKLVAVAVAHGVSYSGATLCLVMLGVWVVYRRIRTDRAKNTGPMDPSE